MPAAAKRPQGLLGHAREIQAGGKGVERRRRHGLMASARTWTRRSSAGSRPAALLHDVEQGGAHAVRLGLAEHVDAVVAQEQVEEAGVEVPTTRPPRERTSGESTE
jgi:hypothetical protein